MKLGVTGTRKGMTGEQKATFRTWLIDSDASEFHHGCCDGADEDAVMCMYADMHPARIIAHPPINKNLYSADSVGLSDETLPAREYLDRNRDIVEACDTLVVFPIKYVPLAERKLQPGSGTWYTYNQAVAAGKRVVIINPDGGTEYVNV